MLKKGQWLQALGGVGPRCAVCGLAQAQGEECGGLESEPPLLTPRTPELPNSAWGFPWDLMRPQLLLPQGFSAHSKAEIPSVEKLLHKASSLPSSCPSFSLPFFLPPFLPSSSSSCFSVF